MAQRVKAGKTEKVDAARGRRCGAAGGNVVDLTELLRRSLDTRKPPATTKKAAAGKTVAGNGKNHAGNGTKAKSVAVKIAPRKSAAHRAASAAGPRRRRRGSAPP